MSRLSILLCLLAGEGMDGVSRYIKKTYFRMISLGNFFLRVRTAAHTLHSIFDWPEQIQTSPTSTLSSLISLYPFTVSTEGEALASSLLSLTIHSPLLPTVVSFFLSGKMNGYFFTPHPPIPKWVPAYPFAEPCLN